MNQFDINIHRFVNKFSDVYEFLYDHHDEVLGFVGAMEFGDWFIKNFPDFTRNFTDYRGDILSSDREVAAYGFVLMYMIGGQMIQLLLFCGFMILLTLVMAFFGGLIALAIAIITRVWPNYITPWLDRHFGESEVEW